MLFDLGCNAGEFSKLALDAGAKNVVGFDFDPNAVDVAYQRAKAGKLNFLPLQLDAFNPSPSQGWRQNERFGSRLNHVRTNYEHRHCRCPGGGDRNAIAAGD